MDDSRVRKASELLGSILSPTVGEKAQAWARLQGFWAKTLGESLASHSRIADLRNGIVYVEADHPGWIQLLQLRQDSTLRAIQAAYPEFGVSGLAFRLRKDDAPPGTARTRFRAAGADENGRGSAAGVDSAESAATAPSVAGAAPAGPGPGGQRGSADVASVDDTIAAVKDEAFRGVLSSLAGTLERADAEQRAAARAEGRKRRSAGIAPTPGDQGSA